SGAPLSRAKRRNAFDYRVRNDRPGFRRGQLQGKAALQIGLVKAWKSHARIHGHKQAVDVFAVVVVVVETRERLSRGRDGYFKANADRILSCSQSVPGQFQMPIFGFNVRAAPFTDAVRSRPSRKSRRTG